MKKNIIISLSLSVFLIFIFNEFWEHRKRLNEEKADLYRLSEHTAFYYKPAGDDNWLRRIFDGKEILCNRWGEGILQYDTIQFFHDFALGFDVIIPDSMVRYVNNPDKNELLFTSETDTSMIAMSVTCMSTDIGENLQERYTYYMNNWKKQFHIISDEEMIEQ